MSDSTSVSEDRSKFPAVPTDDVQRAFHLLERAERPSFLDALYIDLHDELAYRSRA